MTALAASGEEARGAIGTDTTRRRRPNPTILAAAAYAALSFFWLLPSSRNPGTMIADLGDPLHLAYILAWDAHQFIQSPAQLFDANSFYPARQSLAFSEHLIPEAVLVAPVFWATGNAILTYNACVMLGLTLSALAMFALIRELTGSTGAGFLSGIAYSFTGFSLIEIARVQVIHMQWWPLALLFLSRFLARGGFRNALGFGMFLAIQGLSCSYYLLFSVLVAPFWLVAVYGVGRRLPTPGEFARLAGAAFLAGSLVLAVIHPYLGRVGDDTDAVVSTGVDIREFVMPGKANPLLGDDLSTDETTASYAREYIGASTGFLALVGLILGLRRDGSRSLRAFVWLAFITFTIGFLLALGRRVNVWGVDIGPGPLDLILRVVTLGTRHVPRFVALTKLGLAMLVGVGVAEAIRRLRPFSGKVAVAFFAMVLPLEHWQPMDALYGSFLPAGETVPPVYRALAEMGTGPVIELPLPARKRLWALHQYFSTFHWRPIPYGRTRYYPPWLDYLTEGLLNFPSDRALDSLDLLGIDTIVVQPYIWPDALRSERMAAVEASDRLRLVRTFPDPHMKLQELREARVYSLVRRRYPPPCRLTGEIPRGGWTATSRVGRGAENVLTDTPSTFWTTERMQKDGDMFRVTFDKAVRISAIATQTGYRPADFPNHFMLELRGEALDWKRVEPIERDAESRRTLMGLVHDPVHAEHVVRFTPQVATGVRLTLTWAGAYPTPWVISTLRAYQACDDVPATTS